jgi:hypothetical protein
MLFLLVVIVALVMTSRTVMVRQAEQNLAVHLGEAPQLAAAEVVIGVLDLAIVRTYHFTCADRMVVVVDLLSPSATTSCVPK